MKMGKLDADIHEICTCTAVELYSREKAMNIERLKEIEYIASHSDNI